MILHNHTGYRCRVERRHDIGLTQSSANDHVPFCIASMYKPEVQPLVPFRSRSLKVSSLLLRRKLLPLPFLALVTPNIILLHRNVQKDIKHGNRNKSAVAFLCSHNLCQ